MAGIFDRTELAGIEVGNRLVRSATWEGLADTSGRVTSQVVEIYSKLADGGVGLIISSYLYVRKVGQQSVGQIGADRDELVEGLSELARVVHERGGKLVGQIVHCGGQSDREYNGGLQPVAPSVVESPGYPEIPRAFETDEIKELVRDFVGAALRLESAGFDGVQLHGAHGYLLAQFLSPARNVRTDAYGGSLENRSRLAVEILKGIREAAGPGFPVLIKLNANDFMEGSTTEVDSTFLAGRLAEAGIDAIEVSGGTPGSGRLGAARPKILSKVDEAYFLPQAKEIRKVVGGVPLVLVGGLRSLDVMESILEAGDADFFALSRPLIREPDLPKRWEEGDRRRADCVSCLGCFRPARRGEGIRCVNAEKKSAS